MRDVFSLMTGTALAQVFAVVLMPIITRLYSPEEFGLYSSIIALVPVFAIVSSLQLDQALMLPEREEDAFSLLSGSVLVCILFFGVAFLVFLFFFSPKYSIYQFDFFRPCLSFLFALLVFFTAVRGILNSYLSRISMFKFIAVSNLAQVSIALVVQLLAGFLAFGSFGLLAGNLLGSLLTVFMLLSRVRSQYTAYGVDLRLFKKNVMCYRDFPLYSMPQNCLNAISQGLPVLLLGFFYGPSIAGFYALGVKALSVPSSLITSSVRPVLFRKLSLLSNESPDDLFLELKKMTAAMFMVSIIPSVLGFLFVPYLFTLFFGSEWAEAGIYAKWLIIWLGTAFFNVPSTLMTKVINKQRFMLGFEIVMISSRAAVLWLGSQFLSPLYNVICFSLLGSFLNLILILSVFVLTFRFCKNKFY